MGHRRDRGTAGGSAVHPERGRLHGGRHHRNPVLVPDLHRGAESAHWPIFAAAVTEQTQVAALFALPLQWGAANLGVLDLYRMAPDQRRSVARRPGRRGHCGVDDARAAHRPGRGRRPGWTRRWDIAPRSIRPPGWCWSSSGSAPPTRSPSCRAHAFVHQRLLIDVARDVVARRLVFTPDMT